MDAQTAIMLLVNKYSIDFDASSLGILATDQSVANNIKSMGVFQKNGKFDSNRYQSFINSGRLDKNTLIEDIQRDVVKSQLDWSIAKSSFLTDYQYGNLSKVLYQKRAGQFLVVNDKCLKKDKLSDQEINDYYTKNRSLFVDQSKTTIDYFKQKDNDLMSMVKTPSKSVIKAFYKTHKSSLQYDEEVYRYNLYTQR